MSHSVLDVDGQVQKFRLNLTVGVCRGSAGAAAGVELVGVAQPLPRRATRTPTMTKDQKIIRAKVGVLELAKQLCNVFQACKRPPRPVGRGPFGPG